MDWMNKPADKGDYLLAFAMIPVGVVVALMVLWP